MSTPEKHPISLEQLFFVRSVVIATPNHTPQNGTVAGPVNTINISKIEGQPGKWSAGMKSVLNAENSSALPYFIDMECVAVISADDTLSEADAQKGVFITANSVLYGAIREAVSWLTGRQPYGSFLLGLSVLHIGTPTPPTAESHGNS